MGDVVGVDDDDRESKYEPSGVVLMNLPLGLARVHRVTSDTEENAMTRAVVAPVTSHSDTQAATNGLLLLSRVFIVSIFTIL